MSVKLLIISANGTSRTETLPIKHRSWKVAIDSIKYDFVLNTTDASACDEIKNINDITSCTLLIKHTSDNKTEKLKISQDQKNKELETRRSDKYDKQKILDKILSRLSGLEELPVNKAKKLRDKLDIYIGIVKTHNQEIEKIMTTERHIIYENTVDEYSYVLERGKIQKILVGPGLKFPFTICWTIESDDADNLIAVPKIKHTVTKCNMML